MSRGYSFAALFVAFALVANACAPGAQGQPAAAEKTEVVVSALGGLQKQFDDFIIPEFQKDTGKKVIFVPKAVSTELIADVKAQQANPQLDVIHIDEGPGYEGVTLGLYEPLDPKLVPNLTDMYDLARIKGDIAVISRTSVLGLMYNTKVFAARGLKAPTAWNDLFRPEFKGHIVMAHSSTTFGPITLIQFAKMGGGDVNNIDPGFARMKQLAPNVLSYEKTAARYGELFTSDQAWIGVWSNAGASINKASGAPVGFVLPDDGGYLLGGMLAVVKGGPNPKGAQQFVNFMLSPKIQAYLAKEAGFGPLNKKTVVPDDVVKAQQLPYGEDQIKKLVRVDWQYLNTVRPAWTERMAKEVETIH